MLSYASYVLSRFTLIAQAAFLQNVDTGTPSHKVTDATVHPTRASATADMATDIW